MFTQPTVAPRPSGAPARLPQLVAPHATHQPWIRQPVAQPPSMTASPAAERSAQVANRFVYAPHVVPPQQTSMPHGAGQATQFSAAQASQHLAEALQFESQNNIRMAIHAYHRALECDPTHRVALISFARMKHRIGDLDGAIVTYRHSLQYHPNDAVALNDLGLCHARRGETKQALQCLTAASRLAPESRRYTNNLAAVFAEDEQYEQALSLLKQAHGPALGHFNLAMMLKQRGKTAESARYARQAATLDPSLAPARQLLMELGEPLVDNTLRVASSTESAMGDTIQRAVMGEIAPEPSLAVESAAAANPPTFPAELRRKERTGIFSKHVPAPGRAADAVAMKQWPGHQWRIGDSNP